MKRQASVKGLCGLFLGWAIVGVSGLPGAAAEWPARAVRIVAPFGPAGAADRFARVLADYLPADLKQPVVVENRPGGGGLVGSLQVSRAEPDGHTLLISSLASHAIAPALTANPGFDPVRDFTHIAYLGGPPVGWVVPSDSPLHNVDDVIAGARQDALAGYASSGIGTLGHLVAEAVMLRAGVRLNHIPYNTANLPDIIAGHVPIASYAWSSVIGSIDGGTLRGIAVSTPNRLPDYPGVPTFREQGFDVVASTWFALSGPAGMKSEVVGRLNQMVAGIMERPDVQKRFAQDIIGYKTMTPGELTRLFASESAKWTSIAREAGIGRS